MVVPVCMMDGGGTLLLDWSWFVRDNGVSGVTKLYLKQIELCLTFVFPIYM